MLERADRIGGLLRYGIPEFKMEKRHLDRRIAQMEAEGTEFRTNATVGDGVDIEVLLASYDAIVLACGATAWRDLPIPGRELAGIYQAMEYLPPANRVQQGDIDALADRRPRQARRDHRRRRHRRRLPRHGAPPGRGVDHPAGDHAAAARDPASNNPWPQFALTFKITSAHEEGGDRLYSVNTERFVDDGSGHVRALEIHEVEMVNGRFEKVPAPSASCSPTTCSWRWASSARRRARGSTSSASRYDERGNVARDGRYMTNVPGVFVAGDMGRGQSLIVWAIAEGRSCAAGADAWLMGETQLPSPIPPTARPAALTARPAAAVGAPRRAGVPRLGGAVRP